MPSPQPQVKLMPGESLATDPDGKQYIVLSGGVRIPVAGLQEPTMRSGGDVVSPDTGPRLNETPMQARWRGFKEGAGKAAYNLATPENMALGATLLGPETGGASLAIPPLVAGATSLARNFAEGNTDRNSLAGGALGHAALNAIPGLVGKGTTALMSKGGGDIVDAAAHAVPGPGGMITRALARLLGQGAPAEAAAPALGSDMLSMTLPSGAKVFSSQGLKELVQKSIELENAKGTPPATQKALDTLIAKVRTRIDPRNLPAGQLLSKVGMPTETAAQIAAREAEAAAAAKAARATSTGNKVRKGLAGALGVTSTAIESAR